MSGAHLGINITPAARRLSGITKLVIRAARTAPSAADTKILPSHYTRICNPHTCDSPNVPAESVEHKTEKPDV